VGPIANFIEYILGFELNVPDKTITWRISRTEKHGIKNLKFADFYVELICAERQTPEEPCHVTISSGGPFSVKIISRSGSIVRKIEEGTVIIQTS
jgi:hypothetical protein